MDEVVQVGWAAISPMLHMMGRALRRPAPAALHDAPPVPHDQDPELPAGHGPGGKPHPQRISQVRADAPAGPGAAFTGCFGAGVQPRGVQHQQIDRRVTRQAAQRPPRQRARITDDPRCRRRLSPPLDHAWNEQEPAWTRRRSTGEPDSSADAKSLVDQVEQAPGLLHPVRGVTGVRPGRQTQQDGCSAAGQLARRVQRAYGRGYVRQPSRGCLPTDVERAQDQ